MLRAFTDPGPSVRVLRGAAPSLRPREKRPSGRVDLLLARRLLVNSFGRNLTRRTGLWRG